VKDLTVAVDKPGAWIVANETLDPSGAVADELPSWMSGCLPRAPHGGGLPAAGELRAGGALLDAPRDRDGVPLGLAALLTAFTFWWVRKRPA
jgi:hypothetical protein